MAEEPALKAPVFPPAVFLMGPTATGKTTLAVELAQRFPVEIVSVDSALVYRGMDIGTAKPGPEILARVPHHLIDLIEPDDSYSAGRFRDDALTVMREITERGRIPLLAGGTMMYFKALADGLNELPRADPAVRLVIDTMASERGWPALHAQLAEVDPATAARLQPADAQRIQRALEVYYVSGEPMSKLLQKPKYVYFPYRAIRIGLVPGDLGGRRSAFADGEDAPGARSRAGTRDGRPPSGGPAPCSPGDLGGRSSAFADGEGATLERDAPGARSLAGTRDGRPPSGGPAPCSPGDRALLHERIEHRFEDMLELGLIGEVRRLRREYALTLSMPSMRCVGYRQAWKYLDGEYSLTLLRERGIVATRQLAKRQLTWLKAMKGVTTFDCFAEDLLEQVSTFLSRELAAH